MTHDEDPTRWTSAPGEAPELLRGAFAAGRSEGPNRAQMRSLALKIAAASAGGAVAVGTVKAAAAGQAMAAAATWSVAKIAAVVAVAGTLVTGGALVWRVGDENRERSGVENGASAVGTGSPGASEPAPAAVLSENTRGSAPTPTVAPWQRNDAPVVENLAASPSVQARGENGASAAEPTGGDARSARNGFAKVASARVKPAAGASAERDRTAANAARPARLEAETRDGQASADWVQVTVKPNAPSSEIELLHRAQVALQGRPREAFQLTQEHRRLYPNGEFTQERDALAIEALLRVGDTEKARDLAASFVRSYPSSPHAHRFREAMGLH